MPSDLNLPLLTHATAAQKETFERLMELLSGKGILFSLVGSAACREYGLSRAANDLDFVVYPYKEAMDLLDASGAFEPVIDDHPDTTARTCTKRDTKTKVKIDFLTGGIRINNGSRPIEGEFYRDPIQIPMPTGAGDVAPLPMLIAMKLNSAISGKDTWDLGARDGRSPENFTKDISDVRELISVGRLGRSLKVGNKRIQRLFEDLVNDKATPF